MNIITDDYDGLNKFLIMLLEDCGNEFDSILNNIQIPERFYDYFDTDVIIKTQKNISEKYINRQLKSSDYIVKHHKLSEKLLEDNLTYLRMTDILIYQDISENFIRRHKDKINKTGWKHISQYQVLSESFIRENRYNFDWKLISQYQILSEEFIYEFRFFLNWVKILSNQNISEEFFYKVEDFIPWNSDIISRYVFSLNFLNHYKDKLNWKYVYYNENQPLIPIKEFDKIIDIVDWNFISTNKNLNEEFIDHYQHRLNWNLISRYYNCSEYFIRKYKDKVSWYYIENYQNVSNEFLEEFHNYLRGI